MIKFFLRLIAAALILVGLVALVWLVNSNRQLAAEILQLESELGRMTIEDPDKVYLVAIEKPDVPPEVASAVDRIWQFRCYLPPGYDFKRMSGSGQVMSKGVYFQGGFSSSWSSPEKESQSELLTVSLVDKGDVVECFVKFDHSSGTTNWNRVPSNGLKQQTFVVEMLARPGEPAQSFDREMILPILRIYDPNSAEEKTINDQSATVYSGGLMVILPKSRDDAFAKLRRGEVPEGFEESWIASGVTP